MAGTGASQDRGRLEKWRIFRRIVLEPAFEKAESDWEIKFAWSCYEQGRWTPKQMSELVGKWAADVKVKMGASQPLGRSRAGVDIVSGSSEKGIRRGRFQNELSSLRLRAKTAGSRLTIQLLDNADPVAKLSFTDPHSAPEPVSLDTPQEVDVKAGSLSYMRQRASDQLAIEVPALKLDSTRLLDASQGPYFIATPSQDRSDLLRSPIPVFYQNAYHAYFVLLSEGTRELLPQAKASNKFGHLSKLRKVRGTFSAAGLSAPIEIKQVTRFQKCPELSNSYLDLSKWYRQSDQTFVLPEAKLPRLPRSFVNQSPWQDAATRLLPGAIERATVQLHSQASLAPTSFGGTALQVAPAQFASAPLKGDALIGALDRFNYAPFVGGIIVGGQRTRTTVNAQFSTFFHPHVNKFIHELKRWGLPGLLNLSNQALPGDSTFDKDYQPVKGRIQGSYPKYDVDFTPGGAYSIYNLELFFHVPLLLATRLSHNQRFEDARKWFHFVFDPTDSTPGEGQQQFWKVLPLRDLKQESLEELFRRLRPGEENSDEEQKVVDQLNALAKHPFQPHRIARLRPVAYKKFTVIKYLDNLIAWGDQLFRRDTIESINEATLYYVLAAELLGPRPERIPRSGRIEPPSFSQLRPQLNEAGNALAEMEHEAPIAGVVAPMEGESGMLALLSMGTGLYFCIPQNEKLLSYWDVVEDRLFKIRHCMNIEGTVRQLPLFEPPIDPSLLVKAAAAGLDIGSVLSDLSAPLPRYRFTIMLQKALEMCGELKSLGAALLSALEKKDAEALSLTRAVHESATLKAARTVREWHKAEAEASVNALLASRHSTVQVLEHYCKLLGESSMSVPGEPGAPRKPNEQVQTRTVQPRTYTPTGRFKLVNGTKITVNGMV